MSGSAHIADALHGVVRIQAYKRMYDVLKPHIEPEARTGTGSGFFVPVHWGDTWLIVTAAHVVRHAYRVTIAIPFSDGDEIPAKVAAIMPSLDMALVTVKLPPQLSRGVRPLMLGNSDAIKLGDSLHAYGFPLGQMSVKVTDGVYSGIENGRLQHSVPISPGNSGGPLVDSRGRVVGVNILLLVKGVNTAIASPINHLYFAIDDIIPRARGGVDVVWTPPEFGMLMSVAPPGTVATLIDEGAPCCPRGAYITTVIQGSPAAIAGVQIGDVICAIDGIPITGKGVMAVDWYPQPVNIEEVLNRKLNPHEPTTFKWWNHRTRKCKNLTLRPSGFWRQGILRIVEPPYNCMEYHAMGGIVVAPLVKGRVTEHTLRSLNESDLFRDWLLIVDVLPGSPAHMYGALHVGDVLESCCGTLVRNLADYKLAIHAGAGRGRVSWTTKTHNTFGMTLPDAKRFDESHAKPMMLYKVDETLYSRRR